MFKNTADEQRILNALRAFVEEWGAANVRVILPEQWRAFGTSKESPVPVVYSERNSIQVIAGIGLSVVSCEVGLQS
jgi:hypothetical protein